MEGRGDLPVKDRVLESLSVEKGFVDVREVSSQKEHFVKEVLLLLLLVHELNLFATSDDNFCVVVGACTELSSTEWDGEGIVKLVW